MCCELRPNSVTLMKFRAQSQARSDGSLTLGGISVESTAHVCAVTIFRQDDALAMVTRIFPPTLHMNYRLVPAL